MHLVYHSFRFWYNIELSTMLTFFLGVDASPLMTWGAIEGTPMRIDSTPVPSFKMAEPPRREKLAHSLVLFSFRRAIYRSEFLHNSCGLSSEMLVRTYRSRPKPVERLYDTAGTPE